MRTTLLTCMKPYAPPHLPSSRTGSMLIVLHAIVARTSAYVPKNAAPSTQYLKNNWWFAPLEPFAAESFNMTAQCVPHPQPLIGRVCPFTHIASLTHETDCIFDWWIVPLRLALYFCLHRKERFCARSLRRPEQLHRNLPHGGRNT